MSEKCMSLGENVGCGWAQASCTHTLCCWHHPSPAMAPGPHCWPAGTAAPGAATALGSREVEVKVTGRVLKAGEAFSVSLGDT